jgi:hypothetical protein
MIAQKGAPSLARRSPSLNHYLATLD